MTKAPDFDAIIIGAGFGGIYMLKKLRDELGLKARVFDKAGGVGGTWYWNRYPGALSDTESFAYCYSWDKQLLQEWEITTRYLGQPQILKYLEHVVARHDLAREIQLNTGITAAVYNESSDLWEVETTTGMRHTARYLVTAMGLLAATNLPAIKGIERFKGQWCHTGAWPQDMVLAGKRVGVIGTGSTGTQVISTIASEVRHLTVFQRSAQYSVPVGNGPVTPDYVDDIRRNYDAIWTQIRDSALAFGFEESTLPTMSVSPEERQAIFQKAWDFGGGFRFMFETFGDIATDEAANREAQNFIRAKIAEIVKDPETARKLTPHDLYAKRPLCNTDYYATYNRPNVSLVDVKANPIREITETGVITEDGVLHELDVLVFATGFDAVDGCYKRVDIRGRGGLAIKDHWSDGPASYLGILNAHYPNMFMILGPNGPFSNLPPAIEVQVEWISELIDYTNSKGLKSVEPTPEAEAGWTRTCVEIANATLFPRADSWIFGANIPGKTNTVYFYLGGVGAYRKELSRVVNEGHAGLAFGGQRPC